MSIKRNVLNGGTRWALACITGDAVSTEAAVEIMRMLEDAGYSAEAFSGSSMSPPEIAQLYRHNARLVSPSRVEHSWLGRGIFGLGPTFKMVLSHPESGADARLTQFGHE